MEPIRTARGRQRADAILDATLQLLAEVGYDQLTIDAVAGRARSSKTTIYRRWPDKSALVCAALVSASERHPEMQAGARELRSDLFALTGIFAKIADGEDSRAFASLLAAAQQDETIATTMRVTAVQPRRRDCRDVVQRAIGRGELHDPKLADVLFDLVMGQTMVRFLLLADGFDEARQADFVDRTLIPALTAYDGKVHDDGDQ
ncbi:TetR/AcrR family transcriptional regulator [Mycolicibacterium litorale]|nr:TetR/AcrR family transcriptional regulator [Mycolicibacterium litorale]